jgi:aryl-alcohol dehydrogenase-like predicted oxidoreductase
MRKNKLGNTDLHIAPVVFGGNVFGWTLDEKRSFELLDAFTDAGFNTIDTADQYSHWVDGNTGGESETIIGNWLKRSGKREQVIIATKVGGVSGWNPKPNTSREHIIKSIDQSLLRLQTDYVDLYQTHFDNENTPVEETLAAYEELIKAGKVRWIGASNLPPQRLKDSLETGKRIGLPLYQSLQPEYNLYQRAKYEQAYEAIAEKHGLGVITYYSLASGFLTGKYRSEADLAQSARGAGVRKFMDEVAAAYHSTPAAVALAWVMVRPSVTAPIASATDMKQLDAMIRAAALTLDAASLAALNAASAWE